MSSDPLSNIFKTLSEIIDGVKDEKTKQDEIKMKNGQKVNDDSNINSILFQIQDLISESIKDPNVKDTPDLKLRRYENIKSFSFGFASCAIYVSLPKFWKLTIPISLLLGRNYIQPIYYTLSKFFEDNKNNKK